MFRTAYTACYAVQLASLSKAAAVDLKMFGSWWVPTTVATAAACVNQPFRVTA